MKGWKWIAVAFIMTLPGVIGKFVALDYLEKEQPLLGSFLWGLAVIGAAFLLSWAVEAAQEDVPKALAFSALALLAVLPEYSVDFALTYRAGTDEAYQEYALANLIGANRMIVGFAWPLVILIFLFKFRKPQVNLVKGQRVEIGFLLFAGLYSLILPIKGYIDLLDVIVFVGCFVLYTIRIAKSDIHEPELVGPAATLGDLPKSKRRIIVALILLFAGAVIFVCSNPFAESLIQTGLRIGVDEVLLLQWFAPIASEAPEIVVCVLFTWRGLAGDGLGALVASKVNQWTLLVGTLPLVFSLGAKELKALPLHDTIKDTAGKTIEYDLIGPMLVTSAQTILASMIILNLRVSLKGALILLGLFVGQFLVPKYIAGVDSHYPIAAIYLGLAIYIAIREYRQFVPTLLSILSVKYVRKEEAEEQRLQGEKEAHLSHALKN
ncbi:hypothetical protein [Candidatus Chlorohelix sp.]|uniref:hypothetical protein n=1 Tax=Candidatus Chlorohelix sp. TaxID=3139201 RepID=UPI003027B996